jgi:hypothetical protein
MTNRSSVNPIYLYHITVRDIKVHSSTVDNIIAIVWYVQVVYYQLYPDLPLGPVILNKLISS